VSSLTAEEFSVPHRFEHLSNPLPAGLSRRGFLALGAGAAGATVLAGCGGGTNPATGGGNANAPKFTGEYTGPNVTLSYWNGFTGGDGPFMQKLVQEFNSENPKIKVVPNTIQWQDFYQKLPAATLAGKGPDVGVMHMDQLATQAARRVIVPLDDLTEQLKLTAEDFSPEVWDAVVYKDSRYGVPLDVHSLAMYYRTDHFEKAGISEPPTDEASFTAALDKLKGAGYATPFWMPTLWPAHLMFLSLLWQAGGEPYAEDGSKATFDSEAGVQALTWLRSMVEKGYSPKNVAIDTQYVAFKNGKVSVTWDGIWQINDLKGTKTPFGIAPVPKIFDEAAVWANSHNFFITSQAGKDDNKLNASKAFIGWMSERSAEWAGSGMIPARTSVREDPAFTGLKEQSVIAEAVPDMRFLPAVPGLGDVQAQTLEKAVNEAILLKKSPKEALSEQASRATALMEENLQKFGG